MVIDRIFWFDYPTTIINWTLDTKNNTTNILIFFINDEFRGFSNLDGNRSYELTTDLIYQQIIKVLHNTVYNSSLQNKTGFIIANPEQRIIVLYTKYIK